jgi:isoquinoline 1-oxidoreductase subunit alpha
VRSCITSVASVVGKKVTTIEGLPMAWAEAKGLSAAANKTLLHTVQQAWIDEQVPQCGYCQSGMMIQAVSLLTANVRPTEAEIKKNMNGHLCRCGTYTAIIEGIQEASKTMAKELA